MLDTETKRRIDTARDILVGKVPDPKSQVEQITIALIYKFMDDMDKEAISFGGKATFFTGEYKKYGWTNIFDTKVGGHEMLALYGEAIVKLNLNPNIPQLFRDIFKNAYLPYRDPETLKLFLKTINEFSYDHSEMLGDAFEYLLSVLGSQGDAGQFRTPRHIIDFIVEVLDPKKTETICDPACGTAGFLISSYKHILKSNSPLLFGRGVRGEVKGLTPDDRKKMMQNFVGYDISPDMVRLSLVNMYLHGFITPNIYEYDTLTSEDRWSEYFDVIIANPPFMTPKGGIKPHKKFTKQANRSEVLFVDYIAEHIHPGTGKAGIIIPEGIIFKNESANKALRKMLVDKHFLYAVVSLPAGIFNPYSGVKTSILLMDKTLAKKTDNILFVKIDNDGFDLGAQRKEIEKNDLPSTLQLLQQYKLALQNNTAFESDNKNVFLVEKKLIAAKSDFNLSIDRYRINENEKQSNFEMVKLGDILDYEQPTKYIVESENYNHSFRTPVLTAGKSFILGYTNEVNGIFIDDLPVIIFDDFTTATQFVDFPFKVKSSAMKILKAKKEIADIRFVYSAMQQIQFNSSDHKRYWISQYSLIEIPLPPLSIQKKIVTKLKSYQNIIDGAKQIVENYKPHIEMNPDWEMVELGSVCDDFQYGSSLKSNDTGNIPCLRMGNIQHGEIDWNELKFAPDEEDFEKYLLEENDVLFNRTNSPVHVGKTGIFKGERKAVFAGYLIRIHYQKDKLLGDYLNYCLNSKEAKDFCQRVKTDGINQSNINAKILSTFEIPLPSLSQQQQIVTRIEQEQQLVNGNKQLIALYEQKIKDEINKLWQAEPKEYEMPQEKLSIAAEE